MQLLRIDMTDNSERRLLMYLRILNVLINLEQNVLSTTLWTGSKSRKQVSCSGMKQLMVCPRVRFLSHNKNLIL